MRTRGERRHLTKCYQKRQYQFYKSYYSAVWYSGYDDISDERHGSWKTRSWKDCGSSNCHMCCSPRRSPWVPKAEQLSLQERRALDTFYAGLDEAGH